MAVVVLVEFPAAAPGLRENLLGRLAPLTLRGTVRLSFVATERVGADAPAREMLALGFGDAEAAGALVTAWCAAPEIPASVTLRLMQIEPVWSIEPLALMFP